MKDRRPFPLEVDNYLTVFGEIEDGTRVLDHKAATVLRALAARNGPQNAKFGFRNRRCSGLTRWIALGLEGRECAERLDDQEQRCQAHLGFHEPRRARDLGPGP